MTDTQRALLGDREAAKRVTEAGELLPCPWCGGHEIMKASLPASVWYFCSSDGCEVLGPSADSEHKARVAWNARAPLLTPTQLALLEIGRAPRKMEVDINVDDT